MHSTMNSPSREAQLPPPPAGGDGAGGAGAGAGAAADVTKLAVDDHGPRFSGSDARTPRRGWTMPGGRRLSRCSRRRVRRSHPPNYCREALVAGNLEAVADGPDGSGARGVLEPQFSDQADRLAPDRRDGNGTFNRDLLQQHERHRVRECPGVGPVLGTRTPVIVRPRPASSLEGSCGRPVQAPRPSWRTPSRRRRHPWRLRRRN